MRSTDEMASQRFEQFTFISKRFSRPFVSFIRFYLFFSFVVAIATSRSCQEVKESIASQLSIGIYRRFLSNMHAIKMSKLLQSVSFGVASSWPASSVNQQSNNVQPIVTHAMNRFSLLSFNPFSFYAIVPHFGIATKKCSTLSHSYSWLFVTTFCRTSSNLSFCWSLFVTLSSRQSSSFVLFRLLLLVNNAHATPCKLSRQPKETKVVVFSLWNIRECLRAVRSCVAPFSFRL